MSQKTTRQVKSVKGHIIQVNKRKKNFYLAVTMPITSAVWRVMFHFVEGDAVNSN